MDKKRYKDYKGSYVKIEFQRENKGVGCATAVVPEEHHLAYCKKQKSQGWDVRDIKPMRNPWADWKTAMQP